MIIRMFEEDKVSKKKKGDKGKKQIEAGNKTGVPVTTPTTGSRELLGICNPGHIILDPLFVFINALKRSFELRSTYKILRSKRLIATTFYLIQLSKFIKPSIAGLQTLYNKVVTKINSKAVIVGNRLYPTSEEVGFTLRGS